MGACFKFIRFIKKLSLLVILRFPFKCVTLIYTCISTFICISTYVYVFFHFSSFRVTIFLLLNTGICTSVLEQAGEASLGPNLGVCRAVSAMRTVPN